MTITLELRSLAIFHPELVTNEQTRALVTEIERLEKLTRWIPTSERLPEDNAEVYAWTTGGWGGDAIRDNKIWYCPHNDQIIHGVTHWMLLPEPPEEGEK